MTREQMSVNADMSTQMTERFNVAGALLVKLFGRPDEEAAAFSGRAARVRDIGVRPAMANRWFFTGLTLVAALATAVVYGLGGNLVISGVLPLGTLLALVGLLAQLYGPLTALSNVRVDVMTALVSFERVFEVLDLQPMVVEARGRAEAGRIPGRAAVGRVRRRAVPLPDVGGGVARVAGIRRAGGERTRRSGRCSQVCRSSRPRERSRPSSDRRAPARPRRPRLLTRLYDVTGGAVLVGGIDVRQTSLASLRQAVGVVTQDAHMFHDTIRANLLYADPSATEGGCWPRVPTRRSAG